MDTLAMGLVWISVGAALILLIQEQASRIADYSRMQANARAAVAQEIYEVCHDESSVAFYERITAKVPDNLIYYALAETRQKLADGCSKDEAGGCFAETVMRLAAENNIGVDPSLLAQPSLAQAAA